MTTDKEVQTTENASGAVSTMPTSSWISNSNSVYDDSDEEDYVRDEDNDINNLRHKMPFSNCVKCVTRTSDRTPASRLKNHRYADIAVKICLNKINDN